MLEYFLTYSFYVRKKIPEKNLLSLNIFSFFRDQCWFHQDWSGHLALAAGQILSLEAGLAKAGVQMKAVEWVEATDPGLKPAVLDPRIWSTASLSYLDKIYKAFNYTFESGYYQQQSVWLFGKRDF